MIIGYNEMSRLIGHDFDTTQLFNGRFQLNPNPQTIDWSQVFCLIFRNFGIVSVYNATFEL